MQYVNTVFCATSEAWLLVICHNSQAVTSMQDVCAPSVGYLALQQEKIHIKGEKKALLGGNTILSFWLVHEKLPAMKWRMNLGREEMHEQLNG